MAYYENLPIYKKTMELAVFLENVVRNFSRYNKYAIGAELRDKSRRLFTLVIRANSRRDKISALVELRDSGEEMKALIVMAKEVKAFTNFKEFQQAALLASEISRQSEGWLKSQLGKRPESPGQSRAGERAEDHCAPAPPERVLPGMSKPVNRTAVGSVHEGPQGRQVSG